MREIRPRDAVKDEGRTPKGLGTAIAERFAGLGFTAEIDELRGDTADPPDFGWCHPRHHVPCGLIKHEPDSSERRRLGGRAAWTSAITVFEIRCGLANMRRRQSVMVAEFERMRRISSDAFLF